MTDITVKGQSIAPHTPRMAAHAHDFARIDRSVPQTRHAESVRPSLKPDLAYDAQEVMRLSRVLSASDLRAHNDTAHSSVKAKDRVGQKHQGASHNSNALFARRGVIGNVLSASIDSTRASVQYGIPETLLRNAGMNTLAHVLEQGRLKQEHAADAKLSYARDHQGAVIDWADVRGPWSFSKYTGTLLVQSVLPMGAAIAGSAAGAAAGPALGITSAMGLLGVRAASTILSLYPFSVGANLDAQRSGGAHIGKAATLAIPHAAVGSLLGPVAAVSGLTRAAGRAGLPAPSGAVDAMLLTGAGGAASQIGQGLIERSGVNRQNEVFWDQVFINSLNARARDGALLFFLGPLGTTVRPSKSSPSRASLLANAHWQEGDFFKAFLADANTVLLVPKESITVTHQNSASGMTAIRLTPEQALELSRQRYVSQNKLADGGLHGVVPRLELLGEGVLRVKRVHGHDFEGLGSIHARTNALTNWTNLLSLGRRTLGLDYKSPYQTIESGPLKGWVIKIDGIRKNFVFDDAGNVSGWIDPVAIFPKPIVD